MKILVMIASRAGAIATDYDNVSGTHIILFDPERDQSLKAELSLFASFYMRKLRLSPTQ